MGTNSGGGGNTKVIAANAKKAVAQAEKDAVKARAQEKDASAAWAVGAEWGKFVSELVLRRV